MSLSTLLNDYPTVYLVIAPVAMGALLVIFLFFKGYRDSKLNFWVYLSERDMEYPIKPNSRLMYHRLGNVSTANDDAKIKLVEVTSKLETIKDSLQELSARMPTETAVDDVTAQVNDALSLLEPSADNVRQLFLKR